MSLRPHRPAPSIPAQTEIVARAAFPQGNPYLLLRDRLGPLFDDADFGDLYPALGQPAYAPWRLALVTLMQFREGLSDRQAAEAVRARIDWKYLLALNLADPGFRPKPLLLPLRARHRVPQDVHYQPWTLSSAGFHRQGRHTGRIRYTKAGVILDDLLPEADRPAMLFQPDRPRDARLTDALDAINDRFGKKTMVLAREGFAGEWRLRADQGYG